MRASRCNGASASAGRSSVASAAAAVIAGLGLTGAIGCGSDSGGSKYNFGGGPDATTGHPVGSLMDSGSDAPGVVKLCPTPTSNTATVTGKVYDPAGKNPLYNIAVYVPAAPLAPLPSGVPTGAQACSCSALYPGSAYASASTGVDGSFVLTGVPLGTQPLVVQVGKWRRKIMVDVTCETNAVPDHTLTLPGSVAPGDTDDNMPDIAVSTGGADSLECLLLRMGVKASEYVPGSSTGGHVHIFGGGDPASTSNGVTAPDGFPEANPMPGAPASHVGLWASKTQLMAYDMVLLSCEGGETYDANPVALEQYLNAGGRAFASHYHYAWFAGPYVTKQPYQAPSDWGPALGDWMNETMAPSSLIGATVDLSLNAGGTFTKGATMKTWLAGVGALGQSGVPADELSIWSPRYDVKVGPSNLPSQPWLIAGPASDYPGDTMYFSFDTPIGGLPPPDAGASPGVDAGVDAGPDAGADALADGATDSATDGSSLADAGDGGVDADAGSGSGTGSGTGTGSGSGSGTGTGSGSGSSPDFGGARAYCGRAVFSDLHVGGDPSIQDFSPPPAGCDAKDLSPQEKALEFMLFDLSSCVTDDSLPVPDAGTVVIPPLH